MKNTTLLCSALALTLLGFVPTPAAQGPLPTPKPPQVEGHSLMKGTIITWSGSLAKLPRGWQLCDGTKGTPDLRDRFLLGANAGELAGTFGGSHSQTLTIDQLAAHSHSVALDVDGAHTHTQLDGYFPYTTFFIFGGPIHSNGVDGHITETKSNWSPGAHQHQGTLAASPAASSYDNRPAFARLVYLMKGEGPSSNFPKGTVLPWDEHYSKLPTGWAMCDGTLGAPNLIGRFALGALSGQSSGGTGGADQVTLGTAHLPAHGHTFATDPTEGQHNHTANDTYHNSVPAMQGGAIPVAGVAYDDLDWSSDWGTSSTAPDHNHSGTVSVEGQSAPLENRPRFRELPFIIRMAPGASRGPQRAVAMWTGSRASIPPGWHECDGQNGRPDLRGRFLRGSLLPGATGGKDSNTMTQATMPAHTHGLTVGPAGSHSHTYTDASKSTTTIWTGGALPQPYAFGPEWEITETTSVGGAHDHAPVQSTSAGAGSQAIDNRPAFARVIYIMRE